MELGGGDKGIAMGDVPGRRGDGPEVEPEAEGRALRWLIAHAQI